MSKVEVTTIKSFNHEGNVVPRNETITVDEHRARDLEQNGLVSRKKAAPRPQNKMNLDPSNKRRARGESK